MYFWEKYHFSWSCIECKKGPTFAYSRSALAVKSSTCLFSSCFSGVIGTALNWIEIHDKIICLLLIYPMQTCICRVFQKQRPFWIAGIGKDTWPPTATWAVEGHAPSNLVFQFQQFRKGVSFWDTLYLAPLELCKKIQNEDINYMEEGEGE